MRHSECSRGALWRGRAALSSRQPKLTRRRYSVFCFESWRRSFQPASPSVSAAWWPGGRRSPSRCLLVRRRLRPRSARRSTRRRYLPGRQTRSQPTQFATPESAQLTLRACAGLSARACSSHSCSPAGGIADLHKRVEPLDRCELLSREPRRTRRARRVSGTFRDECLSDHGGSSTVENDRAERASKSLSSC